MQKARRGGLIPRLQRDYLQLVIKSTLYSSLVTTKVHQYGYAQQECGNVILINFLLKLTTHNFMSLFLFLKIFG